MRVVRYGEQGRAVAIGHFYAHHVLLHIGQRIDQVRDVKANFYLVARVVDVQLVHRLFLFSIVGGDAKLAGSKFKRTPLNFHSSNGRALQVGQQGLAPYRDTVFCSLGITRL